MHHGRASIKVRIDATYKAAASIREDLLTLAPYFADMMACVTRLVDLADLFLKGVVQGGGGEQFSTLLS